ncbi:hypothetical protein LXL04_029540 [Taraxacum kok-saghyz]
MSQDKKGQEHFFGNVALFCDTHDAHIMDIEDACYNGIGRRICLLAPPALTPLWSLTKSNPPLLRKPPDNWGKTRMHRFQLGSNTRPSEGSQC